MKGAVYQAIRREYRSRMLDLSRELDQQGELSAQLRDCNERIGNARKAVAELDAYAYEQGWSPKDWSR
jgi:hypothetical protein